MTNVASWGGATTAGNFTLVFSGTTLGFFVQNFSSEVTRATAVNVRHNFRANYVNLDGKDIAKVIKTDVVVYTQANTVTTHVGSVYGLTDFMVGDLQTLTINHGDSTTPAIDFGYVYLEEVSPSRPSESLLYKAGFVTLTFVGTKVPEVI